jgi:hypothetical protein
MSVASTYPDGTAARSDLPAPPARPYAEGRHPRAYDRIEYRGQRLEPAASLVGTVVEEIPVAGGRFCLVLRLARTLRRHDHASLRFDPTW